MVLFEENILFGMRLKMLGNVAQIVEDAVGLGPDLKFNKWEVFVSGGSQLENAAVIAKFLAVNIEFEFPEK